MNFRFGLSAVLLAATALPAFGQAGEPTAQAARHVLNFDDVELSSLIADVSIVTGYTFIVHPDVRGKRVTVTSSTPLTREGVFEVFLSTLRVQGFTAVPAGKNTYRIIPEQSAVTEAGTRSAGANSFVTEIIHLDNFNALEAAQMVKPLVDAQGQVIANPRSNTLVVVDYESNMPRIRQLVAGIDEDRTRTETISLRNIPSGEMESILMALQKSGGEDSYASNFQAIASQTGNSIVIRGDDITVDRALKVIEQLDATDRVEDTLRVISLKNADASEIVPILEKVAGAMAFRRAETGGEVTPSTIAFHAPTNSIVINAPSETLLTLERVIQDLDKRRAQVLVEAIIVEMSDDTARELGLQFLLSGTGNSTVPFASTNYSRSAPNLLALAGAVAGDTPFDTGDSNPFAASAVTSLLGLTGLSVGIGGQDGDTLFGAILTAVESDTNSRVLSKPFNMTLDNGTSSLLVGQEVPIITGSVLGSDNSNPFQTVDRKEIGVRLDVTPRISSDDAVRLEINQEVSSIAGAITTATSDLIFNKRQITTDVLADSGEIIVIGGLIQQSDTVANEKVPILGDIPVAGRIFRSEGTATKRTNLMVFIRPTVIRDRQSARDVTARSYRFVRAEELWNGKDDKVNSLDAFVSEVLGSPAPQ
ncbi:MAG: type II secretion system secretin GspD [Alphaproteobacteria bacterium]|nr:type II secretion system secretin GspD [Alphaproteobacteria bacterium]MBU2143022.1 type II secretion system secretin GspD [Alphaproteobacteria bacterium]MBU2197403.1 type II secretion system secretin GspD [Alphaproteobacteria bacterium]